MSILDMKGLKDFCAELKHVFAPAEQHATHLACVALDTLVEELKKKGVEWVDTLPKPSESHQPSMPELSPPLIPAELQPIMDALLAKMNERRSCIDCIMLTSTQLRDLLVQSGRETVSKLVPDGVEYPLSIDLLLQLTKS